MSKPYRGTITGPAGPGMTNSKPKLINAYEHLPQEYLKKPQTYDSYDEIKVDLPFRGMVVGASGSGKTQTAMNIVLGMNAFTHLYLYVKDPEESIYKYLIDTFTKVGSKLKKNCITFSNSLADCPSIEEFDANETNLVIFDDMMLENKKDLKKAEEIYVRGRRQNVSALWITQSYYETPKIIRQNVNYVWVIKIQSVADLNRMCREYQLDKTPQQLLALYQVTRSTKNSFLLIDLQTNDESLKYRNGWEPLIA